MSDVLDIARKQREQLKAEVTYLEAFIRMGEKITKSDESKGKKNLKENIAEGPEVDDTDGETSFPERLGSARMTAAE